MVGLTTTPWSPTTRSSHVAGNVGVKKCYYSERLRIKGRGQSGDDGGNCDICKAIQKEQFNKAIPRAIQMEYPFEGVIVSKNKQVDETFRA